MNRKNFLINLGLFTYASFLSTYSWSFTPEYDEIMGICRPDTLCTDEIKLRHEAYDAFYEMYHSALRQGIYIHISSSYRSFYAQQKIWEKKYKQLATKGNVSTEDIVSNIVQYTAIPGTSRHHWGTDFDAVDGMGYLHENPLDTLHYKSSGDYGYLYHWLTENAHKYGYHQVYTLDNKRQGFKFEPWHYSYKPLAVKYLRYMSQIPFHTLDIYKTIPGSEVFMNENFMKKYIQSHMMGINSQLMYDE
ncbi:MAG: M15 family metallopeptidase [Cytophagales bacterium]|nr:M15 family metallopeptidase [Cytophagales bacterium]